MMKDFEYNKNKNLVNHSHSHSMLDLVNPINLIKFKAYGLRIL